MDKKYLICGICGLPIFDRSESEYLKGSTVHKKCEIKQEEKKEFNDDGYGYKL